MGRRAFVIFACLVAICRTQDSYHEALLEYFVQAERLEQGSGWGDTGDTEEDTDDVIVPTKIVRCVQCSEMDERPDECNPGELHKNLHEFIVECTGLCLNITGDKSVYGCAGERYGQKDMCMSRQGTRICICSSELCNAPEDVFAEKAEEEYFDILTQPPDTKEIVPEASHENSSSLDIVSKSLVLFSLLFCLSQNIFRVYLDYVS